MLEKAACKEDMVSESGWQGPESTVGRYVVEESKRTLDSYRSQPSFVQEQANQEQDAARGGYANRQIIELIQNSADQIAKRGMGRIRIRLTKGHLYCADDGAPLDIEGARSLLFSHLSPKRSTEEIGRFGIGFKSVLGVTDSPAVFSRTGSIQFDRTEAQQRVRRAVPGAEDCPVLRIARAVDAVAAAKSDAELRELMTWATNVVRLPLKPGTGEKLAKQINEFQSEFLLFVKHVESLEFAYRDSEGVRRLRSVHLTDQGSILNLEDNDKHTRWTLFSRELTLTVAAREDARALDSAERVRIVWAAPRGPKVNREPQQFWAYFPTQTSSLLRGILNAPWKTNEDRQSLLPGLFNNELIDAAAHLVTDSLPKLRDLDSPARHLDYLPRRQESGDNEHASRLRRQLNAWLKLAPVVPDQEGALCVPSAVRVPPTALTPNQTVRRDILAHWSSYPSRPSDWVHEDALENERLSAIFRIKDGGLTARGDQSRASIEEWLNAMLTSGVRAGDPVGASRAAVLIAAALPLDSRNVATFEEIVYTGVGKWARPIRDRLFLHVEGIGTPESSVHPLLMQDSDTVDAMKTLGLRAPSPETMFQQLAKELLGSPSASLNHDETLWIRFWQAARLLKPESAYEIVAVFDEWRHGVRARAIDGQWRPVCFLLWPGVIVPHDGSRDSSVAADAEFHADDKCLLSLLGVVEAPAERNEWTYYWGDGSSLNEAWSRTKETYYRQPSLPSRTPRTGRFTLYSRAESPGPVEAFALLSEEAQAELTRTLLDLASTYEDWIAWHSNRSQTYPEFSCRSPILELVERYGKIRLSDRIADLSEGLGAAPEDWEVRDWLLSHSHAEKIGAKFDLPENLRESFVPIGEEAPIGLSDVWPGLTPHLDRVQRELDLIRCDALRSENSRTPDAVAFLKPGQLFVRHSGEEDELRTIVDELSLRLSEWQIQQVLDYQTPEEIADARAKVREQTTDAARLLQAVGAEELVDKLPATLVDILTGSDQPFTGERIAEAAIAVYHTGALREYKHSLSHLDPPRQWAGRGAAVEFVRALGYSDEWAGSRDFRRDPFVDVVGPRSLPPLHGYQEAAVQNLRQLLGQQDNGSENRGLLSLPTGSGKTRVAVQSLIEAIRDDGFSGTILWVADRGELCEQAVEAWRQAWGSIGPEAQESRIARMWEGQRPEFKRTGPQVIVGTIQTLRRRLNELEGVRALVVDEAHGSIAPSYTALMGQLGLTFRRREDEISLIGLTATPYRGRNQDETKRLVDRYGQNRLDSGAFESDDPEEVIRELQGMKVLAQAEHAVIRGTSIKLDEREKEFADTLHSLPESAQERLASSAERTRSIVDAYLNQVWNQCPDWPTLIFATSVSHAKTVAAMLELEGVSARAISAETEGPVRRSVIEDFRAGHLQVLVNYSVFREGFDAPKTRAIIVARPVYSPNLYFQMIGRGLRGELNGGSDRCLIIDVADNIENYDRQLAYTELEDLWA